MIGFPYCKINLGLNIMNKCHDYHNIETIFYPIASLSDVLEIIPQEGAKYYSFQQVGTVLDLPQGNNLVEKAYLLLKSYYDLPSVHIFLLKKIPAGAGLGGGSSDAANCLVLLNELFNIKLTLLQLQQFAARLGSDCSFFIQSIPAFAKGRGEKLYPVFIPEMKGKYILIVKPNLHIRTAEAYQTCIPNPQRTMPLHETIRLPIKQWKHWIFNDFERTLFPVYPQLSEIKDQLYELGALYTSLSGSGSALFGIFDQLPEKMTFPTGTDFFGGKI
jgi:4-diphosphocytidyl-2-C-methyl-D-erythritol kinase